VEADDQKNSNDKENQLANQRNTIKNQMKQNKQSKKKRIDERLFTFFFQLIGLIL
jgi:radical SAM superfamily enzyme